jgi:predicted MFS family arabinose efflux permease
MNYGFVIALMATSFLEQAIVTVVRVTTSYRGVELGISVIGIGIIAAAFSILPIALAVLVGRYIDRGNDAKAIWLGAATMIVACAGFMIARSQTTLILFTALLGASHMVMTVGLQVLCARQQGPGMIEKMIGNYMVANAIGQGLGSYIVGWTGGSAAIPPTQLLFGIGLALTGLQMATALGLRPSRTAAARKESDRPVAVRDVISTPGYGGLFAVGIVSVVAQDLIVIYMPLLGAARGISVDDVGRLLAMRAAASMVARFAFARLHARLGTWSLAAIGTFASAAGYCGLAIPMPIAAMYPTIALTGFALGISVTISIAGLMAITKPEMLGMANSVRMVGNRIGVFVVPFLASLVATAAGIGSVFVLLGLSLAASASMVQMQKRRPSSEGQAP